MFSFRSKPRLSVHERQKQRLATTTSTPVPVNILQTKEMNPTISS